MPMPIQPSNVDYSSATIDDLLKEVESLELLNLSTLGHADSDFASQCHHPNSTCRNGTRKGCYLKSYPYERYHYEAPVRI